MRRILLSCATFAVLTLPAAAAARTAGQAKSKQGFLVLRKAAGDGGVNGSPVLTAVVRGFVLGRVSSRREARIDIYQLPSAHGANAPEVVGLARKRAVRWRGLPGAEYNGSGFRFRAIGGFYRVVVRGAGIYLFAGGVRNIRLRGSSFHPAADGTYSLNGAPPRSLPKHLLKRELRGG
jgi:hypothetical protein